MSTLTISCDDCRLQGSASCEDCVVAWILGQEGPDDALVIDVAEARAVRLLGRSGLVPPLRYQPRAGCA
ncbi:MAG: hypothetical protein ACYC1D_02735 [Acidimicrobiales bacterium]